MQVMRERFWEKYTLEELTWPEWEALCDGCGLCCLVKLEDEQTQEIFYTRLACQLLDCSSGRCTNYRERHRFVPDCVSLSADQVKASRWLPLSCAYRRLNERKPLPDWHPLITGDAQTVVSAGESVAGRCISETYIADHELESHVVKWVKF